MPELGGRCARPRLDSGLARGVRRISWVFADPKDLPLDRVRRIRDEIARSLADLAADLDRAEGRG